MFLVKVKTVFSAAHRLCRPDLTDDENARLYGKCSNPNGHGHNYELEVVVAGEMDPDTGMVANFYDIDRLIHERIFDKVDHRNLNTDVDFLQGLIPTAENLAFAFWKVLEPHVRGARLFRISIGERGGNVVTYYGPGQTMESLARLEGAA